MHAPRRRPLLLLLATAAALPLGPGACSALEPNVGPLRNDGATTPACSLGTSGYGATYGSPSGQAATADFCSADGGTIENPCDTCEAASCCAERVACYSDQACSCADTALDTCTGGVPDASASSALVACWNGFAATSTTAQARYQCLVQSCSAACKIPG